MSAARATPPSDRRLQKMTLKSTHLSKLEIRGFPAEALGMELFTLLVPGSVAFKQVLAGTVPPISYLTALDTYTLISLVFLLLATAMPALLIWSQRRHVMLLVPVALVGIAVAATSRRRRLGLAAVVVAGAWTWPGAWMEGIRGLQTERFRAHHHADAAARALGG